MMSPSKRLKCCNCGALLPGWLPIPNRPESAMLLHHLGADHLAEAKPYLARMEVECIDTVVMELFQRIDA